MTLYVRIVILDLVFTVFAVGSNYFLWQNKFNPPVYIDWQWLWESILWVNHWDSETKLESMQWVHKGSPFSKRRIHNILSENQWRVFFGTWRIEYMPQTTITNAEAYGNTPLKLRDVIVEKQWLLSMKILKNLRGWRISSEECLS